MKINEITIMYTDKGYIAIEAGQIFELWTKAFIPDIYFQLSKRYPNYRLSFKIFRRYNLKVLIWSKKLSFLK